MRAFDMGMIMINLTNPVQEVGMASSPSIWSRPMPLGNEYLITILVVLFDKDVEISVFLIM